MQYPTHEDLLALSPDQRLRLLEDVWHTFVEDPTSLPLTDEHRQELDRRLDAFQSDPNAGKCGKKFANVSESISPPGIRSSAFHHQHLNRALLRIGYIAPPAVIGIRIPRGIVGTVHSTNLARC